MILFSRLMLDKIIEIIHRIRLQFSYPANITSNSFILLFFRAQSQRLKAITHLQLTQKLKVHDLILFYNHNIYIT